MKKRIFSIFLCLALLCGVFQAGILTAPVSANEAYYTVKTFDSLRSAFNQERAKGDTVYITLGSDISYRGEDGFLITNGADVVIDLCGYKLSWVDTRANGSDIVLITDLESSFLNGRNGSITIYDSQRYDAEKDIMIGGSIRYEFDNAADLYRSYTSVLTGEVILHSGTINNQTWTSFSSVHHSAYRGNSFKMYGGVLQADQPLWLIEGSKESGLYGGQIMVMRDVAITVELNASEFPGVVAPVLSNCLVWNLSGRGDAVSIQGVMPPDYTYTHTGADATEELLGLFPFTTHFYVDWVEKELASMTAYDGQNVVGPSFALTYELKKETVDFTVTAPTVGKTANFNVVGAESAVYDFSLMWQYEQTAGHFVNWTSSEPFKSGKIYRALINLTPKSGMTEDNVSADISTYKSVTINGKTAQRSGNSFYADFTIQDEYYNVYIGSTRVSTTNKGDVLGDGGSVQYFEKGEYQVVDYDYDYAKYRPTLVLNNFKMTADDWHDDGVHKAQIYLFEDINIVLRGANELYEGSVADGIYTSRYLSFYGDGKLYINVGSKHRDALSSSNTGLLFCDKIDISFRGEHGIYMGHGSSYSPVIMLQDSAAIACFAYETASGSYLPSLECEYIELYDSAKLLCYSLSSTGVAMSTHPTEFDNKYFDIKIVKKGESVSPYAPENGLNVDGGVAEADCWRVEITGKTVSAEGVRLYPDSLTITPENNNKKLDVTLLPVEAPSFSDELTVVSSNESVLTVTEINYNTYTLTGVANGTATVTVTTTGGKSAKCEVTVEGFEEDGKIILLGDVNGDGKINGRDVIAVMKAVIAETSGSGDYPKDFVRAAADMKADGKINSRDVILVMKAVIDAAKTK